MRRSILELGGVVVGAIGAYVGYRKHKDKLHETTSEATERIVELENEKEELNEQYTALKQEIDDKFKTEHMGVQERNFGRVVANGGWQWSVDELAIRIFWSPPFPVEYAFIDDDVEPSDEDWKVGDDNWFMFCVPSDMMLRVRTDIENLVGAYTDATDSEISPEDIDRQTLQRVVEVDRQEDADDEVEDADVEEELWEWAKEEYDGVSRALWTHYPRKNPG